MSGTKASKITTEAQNLAQSDADLLRAIAYSDLSNTNRQRIADTTFEHEITVSSEEKYSDTIKQKKVGIKVYNGSETIPRSTINLTRYSVENKASGVPIGTIIAWASTKNPTDGTWLVCNGQSCSAYPELVTVLGKNTVPDYRGVFLRGYGSHANNGITHSSGALGEFQNMAFPSTMSGTFCAVNTNGPAPTGPFKEIGAYTDLGLQDNWQTQPGWNKQLQFDLSTVVPQGNELRPVNVAVNYLIKAA